MTPEERKKMEDEEAAKNAALRTGGVESKLAMLNA